MNHIIYSCLYRDVQIIIINSIILSVRISFSLLNNLAKADYMYGI